MPWGSMGTIWAELGLNYASFTRGMQEATQQVEALDRDINVRFKAIGESFSQVGRSLSLGVTAPLALLGGVAAKASMDFETSMANVWTIVDAGKETIAAMSQQVEALSLELPQTAKQLADGLYQVISASIPAEKAIGVLEVSAKAAAAGLSDTFTAVDAITSVLNAYGMEAERAGIVSDIMFKTVERGKTTFPELAQNIGDVVSTAATAGVAFEELAAAISTLTKVGVRTPEAVTAINQALLTFIDPSDEAAELAKQLGIEFDAAALASKGLFGALEEVYKATGGNIEALSALFPNIRALKGALSLGRQEMQLFKDDLDAMRTALGATNKAFEKQAQTSGHAVQIFKNELSVLVRSFGAELMPMLTAAIKTIRPLMEAFSSLPGPVKESAIVFGIYAASIGPVLSGLGRLIALLTGPAGLALAIGAVVAAITAWVRTSRDIDGAIERQVSSARRAIDEAMKQADTYGRQAEELDRLIKEYEELQGKPDKSQQEHERLRQVIDKIVQLAPQAVMGYDDMGRALIGNAEAAKRVRDELWQLRKEQLEIAAMRARYELPSLEEQVRILEPQFNKVKAQLDEIAPRYYKMREVVLAMSRATSDAQREQILQAAIAKGIFDAFSPPATQFAAAEQQYKKFYDRFIELSSALYKAKTGILELKNAEKQLQEWLSMPKPGKKTSTPATTPAPITRQETVSPVVLPEKEEAEKELTEFEEFGQKVQALNKETFGALQTAWAEIEAGLKSQDPVVRTWAEQRARDLLGVIDDAITQFGGDWLKAAEKAQEEVVSGYQQLRQGFETGQNELAKALEDLRFKVAVEGLGIEEQIRELEALKQTDAYRRASAEEQRQIEIQLAGLRESLRQQKVKNAWEEYQFEAQLFRYTTQDRINHLNRILQEYELNAEERKQIENEVALLERQLDEERKKAAEKAAKEKIAALERELGFRQNIGELTWQEELEYLEKLATMDAATQEARINRASQYYSAVVELINNLDRTEQETLRAALQRSLETFLAMEQGGEEMAMAISALLDELDEKFASKTDSWAARIGRAFVGALGDLGRMIETFQRGRQEGGVWKGLSDVILELISKSKVFAALLEALNPIIQAAADMFGELIAPLVPLIKILSQILVPIFRVVGQVFAWVADIVVGIWNAIASVINWALGWLGVHIPTIKPTWREEIKEEETSTGTTTSSGKQGTQISEITGPTRDLLIELMRPLTVLDSLPVYAMAIENAIYEMRDAFLAFVGVKAATEAGAAAVVAEYHINTINIYAQDKEDFDALMASLSRRTELAMLGSGV